MKKTKLLFDGTEWTFSMLDNTMKVLDKLAKELHLDTYTNQIEIISSEQMLDAYASVGLPIMYKHWSFGKRFSIEQDQYRSGKRGLAYELVINSNPSISYLMEENTACTQVLVLAHAAYGHNHFFKNNYLFKQWTDADSIIDYLLFARNYISTCEEKYGQQEVEKLLDSAHALSHQGVDRYKRPKKISMVEEKDRQREREQYLQSQINDLWEHTVNKKQKTDTTEKKFPEHPQENILYFLEKYSPTLEIWQREILRICRKINQYFYPQYQTKVMNEGFACVTGETLIDTCNGLIRADELVNSQYSGTVNDGAIDQKVVNWFYHPNKKRVKVITNKGFYLHGGETHKILINNEWRQLNDLHIGEQLQISRGNNQWPSDYVNLSPPNHQTKQTLFNLCKKHNVHIKTYYKWVNKIGTVSNEKASQCQHIHNETKNLPSSKHVDTRSNITIPNVLDANLAYWYGLLIGDGNIHTGKYWFVNFTNKDEQLLNDFEQLTKQLFGIVCLRKPDRNHFKCRCCSRNIVEFLQQELEAKTGHSAAIKVVPNKILKSPKSVVISFLQGHFDTDGCATTKGDVILVSKSDQLVLAEQQLLLKFGIFSSIRRQKADGCYRLVMSGQNAKMFAEQIGFRLHTKQQKLLHALNKKRWYHLINDTCEIVDIQYDEGPTYDFSVADTHQYKAHGFINHNCFTHHYLMNRLWDQGYINDGAMIEFVKLHTNVVYQPDFDDKYYNGLNPYYLGFEMFHDLKRICVDPTEEDREYFPDIVGQPWLDVVLDAVANYRDESFVLQYLSPTLVKKIRLFKLTNDTEQDHYKVNDIHNHEGFIKIRKALARTYEVDEMFPRIEVIKANIKTDRKLSLAYYPRDERELGESVDDVLAHVARLWGYPVDLIDSSDNLTISRVSPE